MGPSNQFEVVDPKKRSMQIQQLVEGTRDILKYIIQTVNGLFVDW